MALWDMFKRVDINEGVADYQQTDGAVLLDVRTPAEVRDGRIPGSLNVPIEQLERITGSVPNKDTPLFVYCHSGSRAASAATLLKRMGYTHVQSIGGILMYTGQTEGG